MASPVTVEDINKAFAEKGLHIQVPLAPSLEVKHMEVLEKKSYPGSVGVLLSLRFINKQGKEVSDLFFCQGDVDVKKIKKAPPPRVEQKLKESFLPTRDKAAFDSDSEVKDYLGLAMGHLLRDKGYQPGRREGCELYFEREGRGFLVTVALRCDDDGMERAQALIELRRQHGPNHDYGLVVPAFQESLGLLLRLQEAWVSQHTDYFMAHRIGVYGVDNQDPNRIYPYSLYPRTKDLLRYFVATSQQWSLVRARFVQSRGKGAWRQV